MSKLSHSHQPTMDEIELREKERGAIRISEVFPPVPSRKFDYCAYRWGSDEHSPQGWGSTEADAIADLLAMEDE